jgi:RNA polymerase sigma factor (sigma-70 family)
LDFIKNITSTAESDDQLVARYKQNGDLSVLASLYQKYMDLIYGVCLKYLENSEDAQDAVINIYEELITKVLKYEIEHFRAWLYQLAKNHCLMKLRKKRAIPRHVSDEFMHLKDEMHLDEVLLKEERLNAMHKCLEQLVEKQKIAVDLFYLKGKCYNEIASIVESDINTVRSNIQNGRRNLKICMDKNQNEVF